MGGHVFRICNLDFKAGNSKAEEDRIQKQRIRGQRTKANREKQLQGILMYPVQKEGFITLSGCVCVCVHER